MKKTGFNACGDELFVGDILAWHSGYCGYFKVTERDNHFWIEDCSAEVLGMDFPEEEIEGPFKLESDLGCHWTKVDKNNPTKTPPMQLNCDICSKQTGEFDVDTGEFNWFDNCYWHAEPVEGYVFSVCRDCKKR